MPLDLVLPFVGWRLPAWCRGWHRPQELRIDVGPAPDDSLDQELDTLHRRLHRPGDRLFGLPTHPLRDPQFVMHCREADGEWYVYVEDLAARRLAGYTVFNRLVEVDRHADAHVRAPHSKYAATYQRRGLATAVYGWALEAGLCLVSGARQSPGAHALWCALARRHAWGHVELRGKRLAYLGRELPAHQREALNVRMFLLGKGWTIASFAAAVRMRDGRGDGA